MPSLIDTPAIFCGGKFFHDRLQWCHMPSDKWIHDVVHGKFLVFVSVPIRRRPPGPLYFSTSDRVALVSAMVRFLERGIVESRPPGNQGFFSNVFPILKKDGTARVILTLKDLTPMWNIFIFIWTRSKM